MHISELTVFTLGPLAVNCYLLIDEPSRQCVLIDAPEGIETVGEYIEAQTLTLLGIIITHGHFDHIKGLRALKSPFYIHPRDAACIGDSACNLSSLVDVGFSIARKPILIDTDKLTIGPFTFEVIHTPGHSPGSICLKSGTRLFSGDTLFFSSVGRTDIPGGSQEALWASLKEKILPLEDALTVYPGHGPVTSIAREKQANEFLK